MVNRGVEISIDGDIVRTKDFTWNVNANVSYNKNKLVELYNGVQEYVNSTTGLKFVVGRPVHEFFMNRYAGVNPANGDALWYTKDGEPDYRIPRGRQSDDRKKRLTLHGRAVSEPLLHGKVFRCPHSSAWMADRYVMNNDRFFEESNGLYSAYNQSKTTAV